MKFFLIKIILFALPVVLVCAVLELVLRDVPNDYAYKREYLERNAGKIETLVLGSSHGVFNINPEQIPGHAFNAAHLSQSLKYDYFIFEEFKAEFTELKSIWIPIHYRSLFYALEHDPEFWRENYYSIYYDCDYHSSPFRHFELFTSHPIILIRRALAHIVSRGKTTHRNANDLGFGQQEQSVGHDPLEESGLWTVERHTIADRDHLEENCGFLEKLITESKQMGVEVVLFTPPVYPSYAKNMNQAQYQIMQERIRGLCAAHVNAKYYNFLTDEHFVAADFYDSDHLNAEGADKLTLMLIQLRAL